MVVYSASGALIAKRDKHKPCRMAMHVKKTGEADNEVYTYIAAKGQTKNHLTVLEIASRSPMALFGLIPRPVLLFTVSHFATPHPSPPPCPLPLAPSH